jgi:hypothetical protein
MSKETKDKTVFDYAPNVLVIPKMPYENFYINCLPDVPCGVILVLSFGIIEDIYYEKEFSKDTLIFKELAALSNQTGSIIVAGCFTFLNGKKYKSVIVACGGKILGIVDEDNVELSVFEADKGFKFSVLVGDDFYKEELIEIARKNGAKSIIGMGEGFFNLNSNT